MMETCTFCQNEGELHQVEAPAIRLCTSCRDRLRTHIAIVCTGCDRLWWLPKTAGNVAQASRMSDLSPSHIMDNPVIHEIKSCRGCYEAAKEFTVQQPWVQ